MSRLVVPIFNLSKTIAVYSGNENQNYPIMRKFLLLMSLMIAYLSISAQDLVITNPETVPDPVEFCLGESVTFEVQNMGDYASVSAWKRCDEEPDLVGWSNSSKWETLPKPAYPSTELTTDVDGSYYYWVNIYEFGTKYTNVIYVGTKGTVPTLVYTEADTTFCEGSTVAISANPDNLGDGNYKWYKDGVEITDETVASFTISEPGVYHAAAKDANSDCPDNFIPGAAVEFKYIEPAIYGELKLDLNRMSFSTDDVYSSYQWYSGADEASLTAIDGQTFATYNATLTATDTYYAVEVESAGGCFAKSEAIMVNNIAFSTPEIIEPASIFACNEDTIVLKLTNNAYASYQWYKNGIKVWGKTADSLLVTNNYSLKSGSYSVKVTTEFTGTELESDAMDVEISALPGIKVLDNVKFCPGADITLYENNTFDSYKWYVNDVNDFSSAVEIANATDSSVVITVKEEPRYYWLETTNNGCTGVSVQKEVKEFSLYPSNIFTADYKKEGRICMGDSIGLKGGGYNVTWQWMLNEEPVEGMTEKNPYVKELGIYKLEITSTECPEVSTMMKDSVTIKPQIEVNFLADPYGEQYFYNGNENHLIYCGGDTITLSVEDASNFNSWQWVGKLYSPTSTSDDWEDMEGLTDSTFTFENGTVAKLHYKVRVDSLMEDGTYCVNESEYKTIDGWAFQEPAIASHNNAELCDVDDSTLINLAFAGTWNKFEWSVDGEIIPGEENDSIYAKEEGYYRLTVYPELCPDIPFNTAGVSVQFMPEAEIWVLDDGIQALPMQGPGYAYAYQWYYSDTDPETGSSDYYIENMTPVDGDTLVSTAYILYDQMAPGYYAVEVNNPAKCLRASDVYAYKITDPTGVENMLNKNVAIYPNPVNDVLTVEIQKVNEVNSIAVYNVTGMLINEHMVTGKRNKIQMRNLEDGVYLVKVNYHNNSSETFRIIKN